MEPETCCSKRCGKVAQAERLLACCGAAVPLCTPHRVHPPGRLKIMSHAPGCTGRRGPAQWKEELDCLTELARD